MFKVVGHRLRLSYRATSGRVVGWIIMGVNIELFELFTAKHRPTEAAAQDMVKGFGATAAFCKGSK